MSTDEPKWRHWSALLGDVGFAIRELSAHTEHSLPLADAAAPQSHI